MKESLLLAISGAAGGLVSALALDERSVKVAIIMIVVGGLTSTFLTPVLAELIFHFSHDQYIKFAPGLGFTIGATAMTIIKILNKNVHKLEKILIRKSK